MPRREGCLSTSPFSHRVKAAPRGHGPPCPCHSHMDHERPRESVQPQQCAVKPVHTVSQAGRRDVTPGTPHAWGSLGLGPGSLTGEEGHTAACVRTHTTTCPGDTRNQLK